MNCVNSLTDFNSIDFTNYLKAVLCSYLKEKMHNDKRVKFYETKSFWIIIRKALIAQTYSNTNWPFHDYNK